MSVGELMRVDEMHGKQEPMGLQERSVRRRGFLQSLGAAPASACFALLLGVVPGGMALAQQIEPGETRFSALIFANASYQDLERDGDNLNVDLKRLFLNFDHRFSQDWSAHLTTDIQWQRYQDPSDLFVRHLYIQRRIGDNHHLRLGNAPDTWILPLAQLNGYRYLDPGLIPMAGHGTPADWGVHLQGGSGAFSYALAAVTGAGFQKPRVGDSPDYQARVSWEVADGLQLHLGGYRGTRAMDKGVRPRLHTAERWNSALTYVSGPWRLGAEYFYASNWNRVNQPEADAANGTSVWGSYRFNQNYALFVRHDTLKNSRRLAGQNERDYYNLALEWSHSNRLRFSAAYRHIDNQTATGRQIDREFGIWALLAL